MKNNIVIVGATSGIARAISEQLAANGNRLVLAGRNESELERLTSDLRIRYRISVDALVLEATDFASHQEFLNQCLELFDGVVDGLVVAVGYLPHQATTQVDFDSFHDAINRNFLGPASVVHLFAGIFERQRSGFIVGISSVAGDRGRQSNYTYGAGKSAFSTFLQGVRNRLHGAGVHVMTVKPGFVDTDMAKGLVNPDSILCASPEKVAADVIQALHRKRNVVYTRWFWRHIMSAICMIPESVFKRLKL